MGDVRAALQTAQDMDGQAKKTIQELTAQTSTILSDGSGGGTCAVESDPSVVGVLVPDAKEAAAGLEKAYEAAVWAKVTIATLTTLTIDAGGHLNKGDRAGDTGRKPTTRKKIQPREVRDRTSGRENKDPARKVGHFRTSVYCVMLSYQSASCCGAASYAISNCGDEFAVQGINMMTSGEGNVRVYSIPCVHYVTRLRTFFLGRRQVKY